MKEAAFTLEQIDNRCLVAGVLDFTTAREALERIGSLVRSGEHLQVSFAKVTQCNSAALALMIELKAIARHAGHQVSFSDVPEGLGQLAKVCQVDSFIA
jgi:ABC-type transporter Mla MlaB component